MGIEDILNKVYENGEFINKETTSVFVYSSHMEGLGTSKSDLDIYVVLESNFGCIYEFGNVRHIKINSLELDIEYILYKDLSKGIESLDVKKTLNTDFLLLKTFHRLNVAEVIVSGNYQQAL